MAEERNGMEPDEPSEEYHEFRRMMDSADRQDLRRMVVRFRPHHQRLLRQGDHQSQRTTQAACSNHLRDAPQPALRRDNSLVK